MVEEPAATAVTMPVWSTVATAGLLLPQVNASPDTAFPDPLYAVANSRLDPPGPSLSVSGTTTMDATRTADTVTVAVADAPSALAAMRTTPALIAVTTPLAETTAIVESSLDQNTEGPFTV